MIEENNNEVYIDGDSTGVDLSASQDSVLDYTETVVFEDRGFYTTSFEDYTVTEGLLLLIFVILLVDFFVGLVRRWF